MWSSSDQNLALRVSSAVKDSPFLIFAVRIRSTSLSLVLLQQQATRYTNSESGLWFNWTCLILIWPRLAGCQMSRNDQSTVISGYSSIFCNTFFNILFKWSENLSVKTQFCSHLNFGIHAYWSEAFLSFRTLCYGWSGAQTKKHAPKTTETQQ